MKSAMEEINDCIACPMMTSCDGCGFYTGWGPCLQTAGNIADIASDLKEAIEMIKKMRYIIDIESKRNGYCGCDYCNEMRSILEMSKEYSE